jgi:mono/diheme cytochrome c family protein
MTSALRGAVLLLLLGAAWEGAPAQGDGRRGEYLVKAGGCLGCHTEQKKDAVPFSGGRALETPFGTFYGPNITSHPQAGIGRWSEADFLRAMRLGVRTDGDLSDLWAYLRTLAPSDRPNRAHELRFPYGWRFLNRIWKWLFFEPGAFVPDPQATDAVNRGAYLVNALGHCGECHTPRNFLGGWKRGRHLAGGTGPDGKRVPNLTPTRLKKWTEAELKDFLLTGITPDQDAANEIMDEVIRNTTSQLTPGDLSAMIAYLRSLPALPDEPRKQR